VGCHRGWRRVDLWWNVKKHVELRDLLPRVDEHAHALKRTVYAGSDIARKVFGNEQDTHESDRVSPRSAQRNVAAAKAKQIFHHRGHEEHEGYEIH
jgi:hypothetical protein